jgi:hypothetical protein
MYVGARSTHYKFPPLGANLLPKKTGKRPVAVAGLGACCTSCASQSHNPPPMGMDSMTGPSGISDVVDFVTTPTGLLAAAAAAYYFLIHRKRR